MYYQIIRADGSEKYYKIFRTMLDDFDRQDALDLYRMEDEIWKAQQDYTLITRGYLIHVDILLLTDTGITIHMMVEKNSEVVIGLLSSLKADSDRGFVVLINTDLDMVEQQQQVLRDVKELVIWILQLFVLLLDNCVQTLTILVDVVDELNIELAS
ncbi:hypothetical protein Tco_0189906 [Tanacetum coccineum]